MAVLTVLLCLITVGLVSRMLGSIHSLNAPAGVWTRAGISHNQLGRTRDSRGDGNVSPGYTPSEPRWKPREDAAPAWSETERKTQMDNNETINGRLPFDVDLVCAAIERGDQDEVDRRLDGVMLTRNWELIRLTPEQDKARSRLLSNAFNILGEENPYDDSE